MNVPVEHNLHSCSRLFRFLLPLFSNETLLCLSVTRLTSAVTCFTGSSAAAAAPRTDFFSDAHANVPRVAPNNTAYKRWSCHSGFKLLCKLCRTSPPPAVGTRFTVFGHAGHADPLDGWRCCSQKRVMSRPIQVRQL